MSAQNKILVGFAALIAFVIGVSINQARVNDITDTNTLLSARLIVSDPYSAQTDDADPPGFASVNDSLGELTLVNFWASWCAPCREEMPLFENMFRQSSQAGFVVIGIALDSPDKAQPMLDSMDITYPILYAEETGMSIMESVGNPQGLLPYSLLLDKNGEVIDQVLGQIHQQQITDWIDSYL